MLAEESELQSLPGGILCLGLVLSFLGGQVSGYNSRAGQEEMGHIVNCDCKLNKESQPAPQQWPLVRNACLFLGENILYMFPDSISTTNCTILLLLVLISLALLQQNI